MNVMSLARLATKEQGLALFGKYYSICRYTLFNENMSLKLSTKVQRYMSNQNKRGIELKILIVIPLPNCTKSNFAGVILLCLNDFIN